MLYDFSVAESKVTIMFLKGSLIKMFKKISMGPFRCQKSPFGANLAISLILPWPLSLPAIVHPIILPTNIILNMI